MTETSKIICFAQKIWDYHHLNLPLKKAGCIVGLGSYDLRVADRCAELYFEDWAPFIVFSGGLGNWTKAIWDRSEAEIFTDHAIQKGVPPDKIKLEKKATNIGENISFTRKFLGELNVQPQSIIVVTKPSTERRAFATCKKVWPEVELFVTSPKLNFLKQADENIRQENLIHEMVGDIQRIKVYPKLGYQIPQKIPRDVWQAYKKLVSLGYDKHLIK